MEVKLMNPEIAEGVFRNTGDMIRGSGRYRKLMSVLDDEIRQRNVDLKDVYNSHWCGPYGKVSKVIQDRIDSDHNFYTVFRTYVRFKGIDLDSFLRHETGFDKLCYYLSACQLLSVESEI